MHHQFDVYVANRCADSSGGKNSRNLHWENAGQNSGFCRPAEKNENKVTETVFVLGRVCDIRERAGGIKGTCKKCNTRNKRSDNWLTAPPRSTKHPRLFCLHDFRPIKSHGRIIKYRNERLKCTFKKEHIHQAMIHTHKKVSHVLRPQQQRKSPDTRTKPHPVRYARCNCPVH